LSGIVAYSPSLLYTVRHPETEKRKKEEDPIVEATEFNNLKSPSSMFIDEQVSGAMNEPTSLSSSLFLEVAN
jgi:hypothetical protein